MAMLPSRVSVPEWALPYNLPIPARKRPFTCGVEGVEYVTSWGSYGNCSQRTNGPYDFIAPRGYPAYSQTSQMRGWSADEICCGINGWQTSCNLTVPTYVDTQTW